MAFDFLKTSGAVCESIMRMIKTGIIKFKIAALSLAVSVTLLFAQCSARDSGADSKGEPSLGDAPIHGGMFEASGVAYVPGTSGVLFVDDGKPNAVVWMEMDGLGQQVGEPRIIPFGASVENPEGITFDGSYFYVVGSQSSRKSGERDGLARFAFDPATKSVTKVEAITGLRDFLIQNVAELRAEGDKKGADGGLNIEGLAWDPEGKRLLLGLRSPIVSGQALIVPLKLRDASGPLAITNLQVDGQGAIRVSIGGAGIRDIQYDQSLNSFLIISGAAENQDKTNFALWQWNSGDGKTTMKMELGQKMKPEGVTRMEIPGAQKYILIVGDASRYLKLAQ